MSDTALAPVGNSLPIPSDFTENPWENLTPKQLFEEGYAKQVYVASTQAQGIMLTATRIEDPTSVDYLTSTDCYPNYSCLIEFPLQPSTPRASHAPTLHALQEWEGYVLETGETDFTARLLDLTAASFGVQAPLGQEEEAVIPLSEISEDDLKRLRPGSIFRWVIGYERSASGTKRRISQIVIRDLPAMTMQDRSEGLAWAMKVAKSIEQ